MSPSKTPGKKRYAVFRPVFFRAKKGKLLDAALVRDLYDLNTEKYYYSAQNFYQDFLQSRRLAAEQAEEIKKPSPVVIDVKQLEAVRDDLIILIFLAKCNANFTDIKTRAIANMLPVSVLSLRL